jgi:retron-type reverse transcriptase
LVGLALVCVTTEDGWERAKKFEVNLENNLYKLWNRLSSGSYMPPAVLRVEIPKSEGGVRALGIPTIADRVAQMVVKDYLEPKLEKIFHKATQTKKTTKVIYNIV